ncbi:MAG: DUF2778 domain-containing protein [Actinomycetales bacterium]|nr:DUF2778 domain-containing protein [Actinomycetales bacterium]
MRVDGATWWVFQHPVRNTGPIPEGKYWFDVCSTRSLSTSKLSHGLATNAWGNYSWSLHANPTTNTFGRSGFFIHGGQQWGSAGCIDVRHNDSAVHEEVEKIKKENPCGCCFIEVEAVYTKQFVVKREIGIGLWVKRRAPY